ncbi:MAG: N-acetylmuramoyl-L-alanine amidase [Bacteroidales bacterium]|nr:N-acetylmuramoyl-L-alanine amidase [Bacteroidales bacterium]
MKILIDNGHGLNTTGKRSPDGKFLEATYNREIAKRIVAELQNKGYDAELLVPEEEDISLNERVRRVNAACSASSSCPAPTGHPNVILVSIHVNAAGNGSKWMNATGWSCYTSKGQTQSDKLAECLYQAAIINFPGKRIRTDYSDNDSDWEENFYLLRKTLCVAVLSENFFMDSHSDLEYLQSRAGKQAIIDTHVEGIIEYLNSIK